MIAQLKRRLDALERERGLQCADAVLLDKQLEDAAARITAAGDAVAALRGFDSFRQLLDQGPLSTADTAVHEIERASAAFLELRNDLATASPEHRATVSTFIDCISLDDWRL